MHLGDADPLSDLGLRHGLEETQHHDRALTFRQGFQQGPQRFSVLDLIERQIDVTEAVRDRRGVLVASATTAVDGQGVVGTAGDQTLDSIFSRADAALYLAKDNGRNRYEIS